MALNETQVAANELERVEPKVTTLFERDSLFYANVEKRPVQVISNRDMRIPLELKPGGNFGHFDPAGGDLARGDGPTFDKAVINTVHFKFGVEWQKKAEWATDDKRKAVLDTFRHLLAKSMAEFRRQIDSVCMTPGTGVVGTISSTNGGTTTLTLGTDGFGVRLLRYGQKINIYDATLATCRTTGDERTITAIDPVAKSITYSGAAVAGCVATDKIVLSGLSGANPVSLLGVPYHHSSASTGNWLGLDRAANAEVRANSVNAAGNLALPFARLAVNKINERIGMETTVKMNAWMHPCQVQAYEELGQLYMSIQKNGAKSFDPYFSDNLQIAGIPIKKSFSWDKTRIDFVVNDAWGRAEFHAPGFYTESGRKIFELRGASGGVAAASIFYIVASFNLFVNNPPACSYIYGLTVPSGY